MKQSLKVKIEMAKFLQETLDNMSLKGKGHSSVAAKDFAEFFEKVNRLKNYIVAHSNPIFLFGFENFPIFVEIGRIFS